MVRGFFPVVRAHLRVDIGAGLGLFPVVSHEGVPYALLQHHGAHQDVVPGGHTGPQDEVAWGHIDVGGG